MKRRRRQQQRLGRNSDSSMMHRRCCSRRLVWHLLLLGLVVLPSILFWQQQEESSSGRSLVSYYPHETTQQQQRQLRQTGAATTASAVVVMQNGQKNPRQPPAPARQQQQQQHQHSSPDTTLIDATTAAPPPRRDHPHAGALFVNGSCCLVENSSTERLFPVGAAAASNCHPATNITTIEGDGGRQLLEHVRSGVLESQAAIAATAGRRQRQPRILCLVYTHSGAHDRIQAIVDTWGRRCDGFVAFSNATVPRLGAIALLHAGEEAYGNMWQKIRSIWAYVFDHYYNNNNDDDAYDYFHLCGDDVYVVVDNLRAFVGDAALVHRLQTEPNGFATASGNTKWATTPPDQRPLVLGIPHAAHTPTLGCFPDGGPGYTLNRPALELFATQGLPHFLTNNTDSREDVFMGSFFAEHGIWVSDTRDAVGAWRYGANGDAEQSFLYNGGPSSVAPKALEQRYKGYAYLPGLAGVSQQLVALHLKNPGKRARKNKSIADVIYRYHQILYSSDRCHVDDKHNKGIFQAA